MHPTVARAIRDDAGPIRAGSKLRRLGHADPRRQSRQLNEAAAVQGKIDDSLGGDYLPKSRVLRVQQRRDAGDLDRLLHFADLHGEIDTRLLVDLNGHPGSAFSAKARRLNLDVVLTRDEVPHFIFPVRRSCDRSRKAGGRVGDSNGGGRNRSSTRVRHGSQNAGVQCLSGEGTHAANDQ